MIYIPIENKEEEILYNRDERINQYKKFNEESHSPQLDRWIENEKNIKAGDEYSVDIAAPGCGRINYKITRIDDNGDVYGVCLSNHICELEESDVR